MVNICFQTDRPVFYKDPMHNGNFSISNRKKWYKYIGSFFNFCFLRMSFFYYLSIFICQVRGFGSLHYAVTLIPLVVTTTTSAVLGFIRLYRRRKIITKLDKQKIKVIRENEWVDITWDRICAGDIIKLRDKSVIPADVVLLSSNKTIVHYDMCIVNGEKRLAMKEAVISNAFHSVDIKRCKFEIDCERTYNQKNMSKNNAISLSSALRFSGTLYVNNTEIKLNTRCFLERYSEIYTKNEVFAGVLFTGKDCRNIQDNSITSKSYGLEKLISKFNFMQIIIVMSLALVSAFVTNFINSQINYEQKISSGLFTKFFSFLLLYSTMVPLELFPIMDIVLFIHSLMMEKKNISFSLVSSIDELSRIDSIVLSRNCLTNRRPEISRIFINDVIYGESLVPSDLKSIEQKKCYHAQPFADKSLKLDDSTWLFFLHLVTCNSASFNNGIWNSVLPEEETMIQLASQYGLKLEKKDNRKIRLTCEFGRIDVSIHAMKQPGPKHPRVSFIIKDNNGKTILYTRGSHNSMNEICNIPSAEIGTLTELGYHVLCIGYKILSDEDLKTLESTRGSSTRNFEVEADLYNKLERGSTFLALLGFEESLKEGLLGFINEAKSYGIQIIIQTMNDAQSLLRFCKLLGLVDNVRHVETLNSEKMDAFNQAVVSLQESRKIDALILNSLSIHALEGIFSSSQIGNIIRQTPIILMEFCETTDVSSFLKYYRKNSDCTVLGIGHSIADSIFLMKSDVGASLPHASVSPCDISSDLCAKNFRVLSDIIFTQCVWFRERSLGLLRYIIARNTLFTMLQFIYSTFFAFSETSLFDEGMSLSLLLFFTTVPAIGRALINKKIPENYPRSSKEFHKTMFEDFRSTRRVVCWYFVVIFFSLFVSLVLILTTTIFTSHVRFPYGDSASLAQYSYFLSCVFLLCSTILIMPTCSTWNYSLHLFLWCPVALFYIVYNLYTNSEGSYEYYGAFTSITSNQVLILLLFLFAVISFFIQSTRIVFRDNLLMKKSCISGHFSFSRNQNIHRSNTKTAAYLHFEEESLSTLQSKQ